MAWATSVTGINARVLQLNQLVLFIFGLLATVITGVCHFTQYISTIFSLFVQSVASLVFDEAFSTCGNPKYVGVSKM